MSLENANRAPPGFGSENATESNRNPKRTYTREFLISFRDLERCKKLPNGFDSSVLSELEDTSSSTVADRSRGRGEYGSTLTRFDSSSSFTKGSSGRWDTRSTGSSDKDVDSQSERDAFAPEKRYGHQNRKSWQDSSGGHDGLLGKPSGFVSGTSPNTRPSGTYQLKRSSEPYQPPRPFKPAPCSRRDGIDSCNDETFGSTEHSTQDRAEEERKRRASFEMMRKEQHRELHKVLQDKQNQKEKSTKPSGDHLLDLLQSSSNSQGMISEKDEDLNGDVAPPLSTLDASNKPSLSRPIVPPGFASSSVGDKKLQKGSLNASAEPEMKNGAMEVQYSSTAVGNKEQNAIGTPNLSQVWDAFLNNDDKAAGPIGIVANSSDQEGSVSILERFFGAALSKPSAPSSSLVQIENQPTEAEEEMINPSPVQESSKFAQWFIPDGSLQEDASSKDLISLFAKNLDKKSTQLLQSSPSATKETEFEQMLPKTLALGTDAPTNGPQKQDLSTNSNAAFLTCEDLEQFMLAQASSSPDRNNTSNSNPSILSQNWQVRGGSDSSNMDNSAAHPLLSLLHKGTPKDPEIAPSTSLEATAESGNNVTLEALFGAAFMNELHSMDAPVSSHREGPAEPQFLELTDNNSKNILFQGFREREMNINLPEEENLFSVNDPPLNIQPNHNPLLPFTNPSKTEVALHDNSVGKLGNRMLNIGLNPDNSTPVSHLLMSDKAPMPHVGGPQDINRNQRIRFLGPEGVLHDPNHQFHPHIDPAARHTIMQNTRYGTVGFGPEMDPGRHGLARGAPVPHPMHHVHPGFVPHEASGLPNFPMQQPPNFGHGIGIGMPGPGTLELGVRNQIHPEELERILQMEMRAKSQQGGRIPGFHGGPQLGTDIRYR